MTRTPHTIEDLKVLLHEVGELVELIELLSTGDPTAKRRRHKLLTKEKFMALNRLVEQLLKFDQESDFDLWDGEIRIRHEAGGVTVLYECGEVEYIPYIPPDPYRSCCKTKYGEDHLCAEGREEQQKIRNKFKEIKQRQKEEQ